MVLAYTVEQINLAIPALANPVGFVESVCTEPADTVGFEESELTEPAETREPGPPAPHSPESRSGGGAQ